MDFSELFDGILAEITAAITAFISDLISNLFAGFGDSGGLV